MTLYQADAVDGIVDCMSEGVALREGVARGWVPYGWIVAVFVVMAWTWHYGTRQSGGIAPAAERRVMPDLAMRQLNGGTWRMVEHRGQVVLVNYWATWCGPCWEETPGLIRLSRELET